MKSVPFTKEANDLLFYGQLAMAELEHNGFRIDVPYMEDAIRRTNKKVDRLNRELAESEVGRVWKKRFKGDTNLDSAEQLGVVLFEEMEFRDGGKTTKERQWKTDADVLSLIDHDFVRSFLQARQLKNAARTFLGGILREVRDGYVHPNFKLNVASSYRSSCSDPNLQNVPIRDPYIGPLIRRGFIPSEGRRLVEVDFSGAEVRCGCAYHNDPVMVDYILNPESDMHRDTAMDLFRLDKMEAKVKLIRHLAKNGFVFAQFYGSWYRECAKKIWQAMVQHELTLPDGSRLIEHVRREIGELGACDGDYKVEPTKGTFEYHCREVERSFWEKRFKVYNQWRRDWYDDYCKQGWFQMLTGFVCQGHLRRNQVIADPVQGSSFHCLLWSIIKLVIHLMPKLGFETKIICQIHDSIVADVVPEEFDDFIDLVLRVTTKLLPREYSWMTVPMEVEVDAGEVGEPWSEKKTFKVAKDHAAVDGAKSGYKYWSPK